MKVNKKVNVKYLINEINEITLFFIALKCLNKNCALKKLKLKLHYVQIIQYNCIHSFSCHRVSIQVHREIMLLD